MSLIKVENLTKRYGEIRAVDGVSFEVRSGEIYGLLGPNGAGKTTTISAVSGVLKPDSGRVFLDGLDMAARPLEAKSILGVVPQETAIYEGLTARENLRFWAGLYGLARKEVDRRVDEILQHVELRARADEPVRRFSGGMKRRLNLALGLVHGPRAVLLDEPTVGIDPQARQSILEFVRRIAGTGTAVLYTTHYLEEAERLCDRIGIIDHGKLLAEGTLDELKAMVGAEESVTIVGSLDPTRAAAAVGRVPGARAHVVEANRLALTVPSGGRGAVDLLQSVFADRFEIESISIQPPSLNALFLKLTGRELRD